MNVSVIIPVHNEAETVVEAAEKVAEQADVDEVIIVEDGSNDGTREIARNLEHEIEIVKAITSAKRLGKGKAIETGFEAAEGEILAFTDADLSVQAREIEKLLGALEDADIAVGSRMLEESSCERSLYREAGSRLYNFAVRAMLGSKVRDHQCGFKAFKADAYHRVRENVSSDGFFWDTEILLEAQRQEINIKEVPVSYSSRSNGSFSPVLDMPEFLGGFLRQFGN